jgi:hypothetical protein
VWTGTLSSPTGARGLKHVLPEDIEAVYVAHDPALEVSQEKDQTARVLAVSAGGLCLCRVQADVGTVNGLHERPSFGFPQPP